VRETKAQFGLLDRAEQQRFLAELLNLCDTQQLSFVNDFVSPKLKRDPFKILPNELCLRVGGLFPGSLCWC
jgi:F-box and WD-40 domain protein CDC4